MRGPIRRLLVETRPELPRLIVAAALGAAASLSALGLTATSAWLISRAAQHPPIAALMVSIVAVRGFGVARAALRYVERLSAHDAALRVLAGFRVRCYDAAERLSPGAPGFRNADLATRFVADVEAIPDVLIRGLLPLATAALTAVGLVALIGPLDAGAAAVLLGALVVAGVLIPLLRERCTAGTAADITMLRAELMAATVDLADGLDDYLANGAADARRAHVLGLDGQLARAQRRAARGAALSEALGPIVAGGAVAAVAALGMLRVHAGTLGPVWLAVLVLTPLTAFDVFGQVPEAVARLRGARTGLRRLFEVLDAPPVVPEPAVASPLPDGPHTVRLAALSAGWPGAGDCLHDIELCVTPGRRVAVVGDSGAGKSTLAAVLSRFLNPTAGRYLINDMDAAELATDDLRSVVVTAGQDSYLFDNTV
ncbi:MAG TPA: thiol reductant ABC exporter subunit CydC, partial [Sporichthyaceae bacterium]